MSEPGPCTNDDGKCQKKGETAISGKEHYAEKPMKRVLIIDDMLNQYGIRVLLETEPLLRERYLCVGGTAIRTHHDAIYMAHIHHPDIVLFNLQCPLEGNQNEPANLFEAVELLRKGYPDAPFVALIPPHFALEQLLVCLRMKYLQAAMSYGQLSVKRLASALIGEQQMLVLSREINIEVIRQSKLFFTHSINDIRIIEMMSWDQTINMIAHKMHRPRQTIYSLLNALADTHGIERWQDLPEYLESIGFLKNHTLLTHVGINNKELNRLALRPDKDMSKFVSSALS